MHRLEQRVWNFTVEQVRKLQEIINMNTVETDILNAAQTVAPDSPVVQIAGAAIATAADPSPANILADLELAVSLVKKFKDEISTVHPSVLALVKMMF